MRMRILKWAAGALAMVLLTAAAAVWLAGWNWLRAPLGELVKAETGRPLTIGGDLKIGFEWPQLRVEAADISLGNPDWAAARDLLRAGRLALGLDLGALLERRLALAALTIVDADLHLEVGPAGQRNWQFGAGSGPGAGGVPLERLVVQRSRLAFDDGERQTHVLADLDTDAGGGLRLAAAGQYRGRPLRLQLSGGQLISLRDENTPYPFRIAGDYGRSSLQATGAVTGIARLGAIDTRFELRGRNLADLYPLLGIALLDTGPYRFAGRLTKDGALWRFTELDAHAGNSNFTGRLQFDAGARPLAIAGDLVFRRLDFADLGPAIGKRSVPAAAVPGKPPRVLPDQPFRIERWPTVSADLRLQAGRIIRKGELPLDDFSTRLRLADSVLTLDPLRFGIAAGQLAGKVRLDGRRAPLRAEIELEARRIVFAQLFPGAENRQAQYGRLSGSLKLTGSGETLGGMLASADGRGGFVVTQGEISRLMMELAGLHVLEAVVVALAGDRPIVIRCGAAAFEVRAGVLHSQQLVLDTQVTKILGGGTIDFAREQLDLTLRPQAKAARMISLRSPIHVRGPFSAARVEIDKGALLARGAGALALGAVNPLLALAPLLETGHPADDDCARRLAREGQ